MSRRFVKKPLEIEAFRIGYDEAPAWFVDADECIPTWGSVDGCNTVQPTKAMILTLEGTMQADTGDYVIKGIKGEIYPCKADIFEESYDEVPCAYVAKVGAPFDAKVWAQPGNIIPVRDNE